MYRIFCNPLLLILPKLKSIKTPLHSFFFFFLSKYILGIQTVLYSETDFITVLSWCGLLLSSAYIIYTKVKNFPLTTLFFNRASHKKRTHWKNKISHLFWFHKGNMTVQCTVLLVLYYAQIFDLLHKNVSFKSVP